MLKIFSEHKNNICIIISFSENLNTKKTSEIEFIFQTKFDIPKSHVIFSSTYSTKEYLLKSLNIVKNNVQNIDNIKFSKRNLINTAGKEGISLEVYEIREKYKKEYDDAIETFRKEFTNTNEYALKFALYYSFRDYKDNLIELFSNIVKKTVIDIDSAIIEIITFNNELYEPFEKITKIFEGEMKVESASLNNSNRYKKCPNCGRIWFKINGCNSMRCGNRTKKKDIFYGMFKNYIVKFTGKIFNITNLEDEKVDEGTDSEFFGITEEESKQNLNRNFVHKIQPEGCGNQLNWDSLEDVTDMVNAELKKTYHDKTYDNKMRDQIKNLKLENQFLE
jgi:hypothetical protein